MHNLAPPQASQGINCFKLNVCPRIKNGMNVTKNIVGISTVLSINNSDF